MTIAMIAYNCMSTSFELVSGGSTSSIGRGVALPSFACPLSGASMRRISNNVACCEVASLPDGVLVSLSLTGRILEEFLDATGVALATAESWELFAVEEDFAFGCRCEGKGGRNGSVVMARGRARAPPPLCRFSEPLAAWLYRHTAHTASFWAAFYRVILSFATLRRGVDWMLEFRFA